MTTTTDKIKTGVSIVAIVDCIAETAEVLDDDALVDAYNETVCELLNVRFHGQTDLHELEAIAAAQPDDLQLAQALELARQYLACAPGGRA